MKKISAILLSVFMSSTVFAGVLDGITYCGPKSGRCISFANDKATKNGKSFNYTILEGQIFNLDKNRTTGVEVHDGGDTLLLKSGEFLIRR